MEASKAFSELEFKDKLALFALRDFLSAELVHAYFIDKDWSWFTRKWSKAGYRTTEDGMYPKELVKKIEAAEASRQNRIQTRKNYKSKSKI